MGCRIKSGNDMAGQQVRQRRGRATRRHIPDVIRGPDPRIHLSSQPHPIAKVVAILIGRGQSAWSSDEARWVAGSSPATTWQGNKPGNDVVGQRAATSPTSSAGLTRGSIYL